MRWPWMKPRPDEGDRPNPEKARRDLARLRGQRAEVERLLQAFRVDRAENHYGQNVEKLFRGDRS